MDRRGFLRSLGIIGGGAAVASCTGAPEEQMRAYLTPPREMTPGVAAYFASVCRACPAGCGLMARVREARPVKLEGNPHHPVNRGALCARGQAQIQSLYSRARVQHSMVRRDDGTLANAASWEHALATAGHKLEGARAVGLLTGLEQGAFDALVADLGRSLPGFEHRMYEPAALRSMAAASKLLFGRDEVPRIDLSGAGYVLSLGADFLDTWVSPVELSRQWAERHAFDAGRKQRMDYVGPRRNLTATAADEWLRLPTAEVGALALALLHALLPAAGSAAGREAEVRALAGKLGPAPALSGERQQAMERLAGRLRGGDALVLFGGAEVLAADATAVHAAVLLINHLTGALGKHLRFAEGYALSRASSARDAGAMLERAASGELDALIVVGGGPLLGLPGGPARAAELVKRGNVIALAYEARESDASTEVASVVLPVHHPLESWGDYSVARGVHGLMQPVRVPLYRTRHTGDVLIELARRAGKPVAGTTYRDYVVKRWTPAPEPSASTPEAAAKRVEIEAALKQVMAIAPPSEQPAAPAAAALAAGGGAPIEGGVGLDFKPAVPQPDGEPPFERALAEGGDFGVQPAPSIALALRADAALPAVARPAAAGPSVLVAPMSLLRYDGRGAAQDLLWEVPDAVLQTSWEAPVEIPAELASRQGLRDGDRVALKAGGGASLEARVAVVDDLEPSTIAVPFGAAVRGGLAAALDPTSGELAPSGAALTVTRQGTDRLVSVLGSPHSEGRNLVLSVSLRDAKRGAYPKLTRHGEEPASGPHPPAPLPYQEQGGTRPADSMIALPEYPDHRWGLTVDLDRCTGCSACVVACYTENNVPIVGRDEVGRGRELSWLRIEKHVVDSARRRSGRVRFLPVMCQHCDNAPCETVCPVFASYHTRDGLNGQLYNRCIGTRYCANNCPYKVRRFNYFDYEWRSPERQRLNPDVTVRSRGVMEKCTLCVQRIREATNRARAEGRRVKDGEIVPACVQTCPTGALRFGDHKSADGRMAALARDPRAYRLLDYTVNTRPGVVYLRKVDTDGDGEAG